jgi:hypothetical protein
MEITHQNIAQTAVSGDEAISVLLEVKALGALVFFIRKGPLQQFQGIAGEDQRSAPNIHLMGSQFQIGWRNQPNG